MPKTLPGIPRIAACAAALALAALAIADYRSWRGERDALLALLEEAGTASRQPEVAADVRREPASPRAAVRAARGLLADEIDLRFRTDLAPEERQRARAASPRRLESASRLAAAVLGDQPASWQGAMVLGGAAFLDLSRRRDPRLATESALWERPLGRARELAPGQPEPTRLLAAAYLNLWSRLDGERRRQVEPIVVRALAHPDGFPLLIEPWLRAAPSLADAFAAIPDRPLAWRQLEQIFARAGDWERFCQARDGGEASLARYLEALVAEAAARRRGGDLTGARQRLLSIAAAAPPSKRFAPHFAEVLERLPPGTGSAGDERAFRAWLDWALDRCLLFDCPFAAAQMRRLAERAAARESPVLALAALAAGDDRRAEVYGRRAPPLPTPEWSSFHLLRARRALERQRPAEARAALARVDPAAAAGPLFAALARAARSEAVPTPAAEPPPAVRGWGAEAWRQKGYSARLELEAPAADYRLDVEMRGAAADGGAVEVLWDGDLLGRRPVAPGESLRFRVGAGGGIHLLEVRRLEGRPGMPGRAILTPG